MQTSLDPISEPHSLKYNMSKFEHLPGSVYQRSLDRLVSAQSNPKFGVKECISMRELYRRVMSDPELYYSCTIYSRPVIK